MVGCAQSRNLIFTQIIFSNLSTRWMERRQKASREQRERRRILKRVENYATAIHQTLPQRESQFIARTPHPIFIWENNGGSFRPQLKYFRKREFFLREREAGKRAFRAEREAARENEWEQEDASENLKFPLLQAQGLKCTTAATTDETVIYTE